MSKRLITERSCSQAVPALTGDGIPQADSPSFHVQRGAATDQKGRWKGVTEHDRASVQRIKVQGREGRSGYSSGWRGSKDRVGQGDVQGVIVLHQRRVLVVQDQVLERGVEVVGLREAEAGRRLVDHAVLGVPIHPVGKPAPSPRLPLHRGHDPVWMCPPLPCIPDAHLAPPLLPGWLKDAPAASNRSPGREVLAPT